MHMFSPRQQSIYWKSILINNSRHFILLLLWRYLRKFWISLVRSQLSHVNRCHRHMNSIHCNDDVNTVSLSAWNVARYENKIPFLCVKIHHIHNLWWRLQSCTLNVVYASQGARVKSRLCPITAESNDHKPVVKQLVCMCRLPAIGFMRSIYVEQPKYKSENQCGYVGEAT